MTIPRKTIRQVIEAFFACGFDTDQMEEGVQDRHVVATARYLDAGLKPWEDGAWDDEREVGDGQ